MPRRPTPARRRWSNALGFAVRGSSIDNGFSPRIPRWLATITLDLASRSRTAICSSRWASARSSALAQELWTDLGKIVRLYDDGRIPNDNPFVGRAGARPEIWSYGHRNPHGLAFHPQTGELWESEHGPLGGDEINVIKRGLNYGWPTVTFGREYDGGPSATA